MRAAGCHNVDVIRKDGDCRVSARITMKRLLCVIASRWSRRCRSPHSRRPPAYPSKPIRLIVPFPPGAGTDSVARLVAQKLGDALGTAIVVDNRTGAGGAIGAAEAAKAAPDGYTLLFVAGPFTTVAAASRSPGYDPIRQFTPVAPIAAGPLAFVINADVPAGTMREFIALAKAKPGTLNYGSAGTGSINHLALELLKLRTGVDIVHVPVQGHRARDAGPARRARSRRSPRRFRRRCRSSRRTG